MIELSGAGSGSIPLTNGSGSGSRRPKNIRILRIRIRNTDLHADWLYWETNNQVLRSAQRLPITQVIQPEYPLTKKWFMASGAAGDSSSSPAVHDTPPHGGALNTLGSHLPSTVSFFIFFVYFFGVC
jgi:hypothetical protein